MFEIERNFTTFSEEELEIKIKNCYPRAFLYIFINETNFTNKTYGKLKIKKSESGKINLSVFYILQIAIFPRQANGNIV